MSSSTLLLYFISNDDYSPALGFTESAHSYWNVVLFYLESVIDAFTLGFYDALGLQKISPIKADKGVAKFIHHLLKFMVAAGIVESAYKQLKYQKPVEFHGTVSDCLTECDQYDIASTEAANTYSVEIFGTVDPEENVSNYNMESFIKALSEDEDQETSS